MNPTVPNRPNEPGPTQPAGPHKRNWLLILILGLSLFIVIGVVAGLALIDQLKPQPPDPPRDSISICQDFIRDRLKDAAALDFEPVSEIQTDQPYENHFEVTLWVDVKSDTGTKQRTTYTCSVTRYPDETWFLDYLEEK